MAVAPKFSSLQERKRYFADVKFGKLPNQDKKPQPQRNMTHSEYQMLQALSETVEQGYLEQQGTEITKIPYFTNNVEGVNIFKENKKPSGNDLGFHLRFILEKIIFKVFESNDVNPEQVDLNKILLHLQYPMEKDVIQQCSNMVFDSLIVQNDGFTTVRISDVILYAMVKDCSYHMMALSGTRDVYLLGSDIQFENYYLSRPEFDNYFITLTKTVYATTLIGRNVDQLGLMDYPSYQFSLGTYSFGTSHSNKFLRTLISNTLVHVIPFWNSVFNSSFLVELATTDVKFNYQHDTIFAYYEHDIEIKCFNHVSNRTENIMAIPLTVSLANDDDSMKPFDVYTANINVRNKISTKLDGLKNFNKIKDKMYPKDRSGAKTKLESCLTHLDVQRYKSVLDIGSAPGTWINHLLNYQHLNKITGVTRKQYAYDLNMYPEVIQNIEQDPRAEIIYADAVQHILNLQNYDLIVSDLATKHTNYITQSLDHDELFTALLVNICKKLNVGGAFIMKMYDLTPKMCELMSFLFPYFEQFKVIKAHGSCPTNPETYVLGINYTTTKNSNRVNIVNQFNTIIHSQIAHLNRLLTQGFGIQSNYELFYINNRLRISNIEYIPYHLTLCLTYLKFSESLYPTNITGTMYDETTLLGDKYLRIKWDMPAFPQSDVMYINETNIGYESENVGLQNLFIMHSGYVIQDGFRKDFFLLEKESSCMFSTKYATTCVASTFINELPFYQLTMKDLINDEKYVQFFPGINDFNRLHYYLRQLSLAQLLSLQQFYNVNSANTILNQFFRESETMRLFYSKGESYTNIRRSKDRRVHKKIDLSNQNDRKEFVEIYKRNCRMGKTVRQAFFNLLNEYTIQIWKSELLATSICTTKGSYSEYKTGQICISQPACVQLRRQEHIL
ncbi:hypothetical protein [Ceratitis capitata reo-like virus 1]|nr:hypothetical protein [Ceratitis capitata reo-like virus 1]